MKITTTKRIDPKYLDNEIVTKYKTIEETGESNDGYRRSFTYHVNHEIHEKITNEIKNPDGTYTYDYIKIHGLSDSSESFKEVNYNLSESELNSNILSIMYKFNVHEFTTEYGTEVNRVEDCYVKENELICEYKLGKNGTYETNAIRDGFYFEKKDKTYKDPNIDVENENACRIFDNGCIGLVGEDGFVEIKGIVSDSVEDVNKIINEGFTKKDYISLMLTGKLFKAYTILLGFGEIGDDDVISEYHSKINLETPPYMSLEEALEKGIISLNDIKDVIKQYSYLPMKFSEELLEQILGEEPSLVENFNDKCLSTNILRKYKKDFDFGLLKPSEFLPEDLDKVLKFITSFSCRFSYGDDAREEIQEYYNYLKLFINDPESLKKIIPEINKVECGLNYFSGNVEFMNQISPDVMSKSEIIEILLDNNDVKLREIFKYTTEFDEKSTRKLMDVLKNKKASFEMVCKTIEIAKKNNISNDEILQMLRDDKFEFLNDSYMFNGNFSKFLQFNIKGIKFDEVAEHVKDVKNYSLLDLCDAITPEEASKEFETRFKQICNENSNNGKKNNCNVDANINDMLYKYKNLDKLFSKTTDETKLKIKKMIIDNLDENSYIRRGVKDFPDLSEIIRVLNASFDISLNDMKNIYKKSINSGIPKEIVMSYLLSYAPEEKKEEYERNLNQIVYYPSPKYNWQEGKNCVIIPLDTSKGYYVANRSYVKETIQKNSEVFSTKINYGETDMVGNKDGKPIAINNLSKYLFGVPGAYGNLQIDSSPKGKGMCIKLPYGTPDVAVRVIEESMNPELKHQREEEEKAAKKAAEEAAKKAAERDYEIKKAFEPDSTDDNELANMNDINGPYSNEPNGNGNNKEISDGIGDNGLSQ